MLGFHSKLLSILLFYSCSAILQVYQNRSRVQNCSQSPKSLQVDGLNISYSIWYSILVLLQVWQLLLMLQFATWSHSLLLKPNTWYLIKFWNPILWHFCSVVYSSGMWEGLLPFTTAEIGTLEANDFKGILIYTWIILSYGIYLGNTKHMLIGYLDYVLLTSYKWNLEVLTLLQILWFCSKKSYSPSKFEKNTLLTTAKYPFYLK